MFSFATDRPRRRPSLTPMIDVVFLLLVFFMLTAQFSRDTTLPLRTGGGGAGQYDGPPRLLRIGGDGLWLNGRPIALADSVVALEGLMRDPGDLIVLRGGPDADVQRVVEVMQHLGAAGFTGLTLVE
ncbi:biopolymer transporter ExbD [uncultured Aliiroseovarius sp.]|uniref:ExbD/TolR family protein n=1 Tax=uncultured Aliiroseovarius sp. TaxID=1658783 RepID=UPI0025934273|nr:biopolymer transporter ExbD [uncultured Aliiroseovarius sp.]